MKLVAQADQPRPQLPCRFIWLQILPKLIKVTHKVAATVSAAFANRDAPNGLSVGTATTTDNTSKLVLLPLITHPT